MPPSFPSLPRGITYADQLLIGSLIDKQLKRLTIEFARNVAMCRMYDRPRHVANAKLIREMLLSLPDEKLASWSGLDPAILADLCERYLASAIPEQSSR